MSLLSRTPNLPAPKTLAVDQIEAKRAHHARKKYYLHPQYEELLAAYVDTHDNLTFSDYVRADTLNDRRILLLRHDIDHDYETALRMARWEHSRGLRATYCVLHSAWYYGELVDGSYEHTRELVELCRTLQELGHEINWHNNTVVVGLEAGVEPRAVLRGELDALRSHGIDVSGTSTHGDALCRQLNFANSEVFREAVKEERGGVRTLKGRGGEVTLGLLDYAQFGLEYEAYDIARNVYITDSGGRLRCIRNAPGRRSFARTDAHSGEVIAILTHPVWWDFEESSETPCSENGSENEAEDTVEDAVEPASRGLPKSRAFIARLPRKSRESSRRRELPENPKKIIKKSDDVDYLGDFLDLMKLPCIRMTEVANATPPYLYIRHDVDHDLDCALAIAAVEREHGYRSTYFLLAPGSYPEGKNYYGILEDGTIVHHPQLIEKCKRLLDLGHDLGFHSDAVAIALQSESGLSPRDFIAREVEFFDRHGIPLVGTAAHGSPLARQLKFNNRELFAGCVRKGWEPGRTVRHHGREVRLHSLKLEDFGFGFEAYSLPRDSRISESGGRWRGRVAGEGVPKEELEQSFALPLFRSLVSRVRPETGIRAMSIMTHPVHWRVE